MKNDIRDVIEYIVICVVAFAIASLMVLAYLTTPAKSATACRDEAGIRHDVAAVFPNVVFADLDGKDLKIFEAGFNALPPTSNVDADHALVIKAPQTPFINIVFFKAGCMYEHDRMNAQQFQSIFESM